VSCLCESVLLFFLFSFMWLGLCLNLTCMFDTNWAPNKWRAANTVAEIGPKCFVHTLRSEMRGPNQAVKVKAVLIGRR